MSEHTPIQEIIERLSDLVEALNGAGAQAEAKRVARFRNDFSAASRVRQAVQGLQTQLQRWREHPEALPESATVHVAANVLEDACRNALKGGVIEPAPLTLQQQARRKLLVTVGAVVATAAVGAAVFALQVLGFDVTDPIAEPEIRNLVVPQGGERSTSLIALSPALLPDSEVTSVSFRLSQPCDGAEYEGMRCSAYPEQHMWAVGRLPTSELKLTHQAYGLLMAFGETELRDGVGRGQLHLAATGDTPQGQYLLHFEARYHGYAPAPCGFIDRVLDRCPPPKTGDKRQHAGVAVHALRVEVGPPSEADRLAARERARRLEQEQRKRTEARAKRIMAMLGDIEAALDVNDAVIKRRKFLEVRDRIGKLTTLFEPLDVLLADPEASGQVPQEVIDVRERFGDQRDALQAFEDDVFDQLFALLHADADAPAPDDDEVMAKVAKRRRIDVAYVEEIYAEHAEELQSRLERQAEARLEAKKRAEAQKRQRCGELEGGGWKAIEAYLKKHLENEHVAIKLGECMSPLLTDECWEVGCDYVKTVTVDALRPSKSRDFKATFRIRDNRVLGYVPR